MRSSLTVTAAMWDPMASGVALAGERPAYVLVHGAFHGGWAWQQVADDLRASEARVYTPTLTGLGERAHLARPGVALSTHVQDIVSLIEMEDLHDVILVGHSYAGMVITGVAAAVPTRIKKLVYLDAVIPEPGQSFFETIAFGQAPPLELMPSFPPEAFGLTKPEDLAYVGARLRPQPMGTFEEPLAFSWDSLASIPKLYVRCTGEWFSRDAFLAFATKAQARQWAYEELDSGHDAMVTAASDTLRLLRRAAR